MKPRSVKIALLAALALTNPLLTFAGEQPAKERNTTSTEDLSGTSRAVPQGKGTGVTRPQEVPADAYRAEKAEDATAKTPAVRPNPGDSAFRK